MNPIVIALCAIVNLVLLLPSLARAESEVEQEFYDSMGSSGWDYEYEEDEEQLPEEITKRNPDFDLESSPNQFFGADSIPVVDEQVSRSELQDKIKKNVK